MGRLAAEGHVLDEIGVANVLVDAEFFHFRPEMSPAPLVILPDPEKLVKGVKVGRHCRVALAEVDLRFI